MSTRPTRAQSLLYNHRPAGSTRIRASSAAAMIGELSASLGELRAAADISGLLGAQAMALAIAEVTTDPAIAKKAQRIAKKAGAVAVRLQRNERHQPSNGALARPPEPGQQAPVNGATPPAIMKQATGAGADVPDRGQGPISIETQLSSRLLRLLQLLLDPGQPTPQRAATLRALAEDDRAGAEPVELPTLVRSWLPLLLDGYEQGRRLSSAVPLGVVKHRHEQQIERELRDTAARTSTSSPRGSSGSSGSRPTRSSPHSRRRSGGGGLASPLTRPTFPPARRSRRARESRPVTPGRGPYRARFVSRRSRRATTHDRATIELSSSFSAACRPRAIGASCRSRRRGECAPSVCRELDTAGVGTANDAAEPWS